MQLGPLFYDAFNLIYEQAHLSDFTIKTFIKTMRKKKNFQRIYRKLFYGISIHHRTPF